MATASTAPDLTRLRRWRTSTFWVMLLGYIGYYLCRKNLSAAFPLLSQSLGYTNTELGLIALYSEIAYALGKFINGPLGDRIGGRRIFLIGMVGAICCNVWFGFCTELVWFIICWCVCRYFLSAGWGGIVKTMGAWYEPERNGTIMGLISVSFQFGGVLAVLFAGWLVSRGASWPALFWYPAGVLALVLIWSALASRAAPEDVVPGTTFGQGERAHRSIARLEDAERDAPGAWPIVRKLLSIGLFRQVLVFSFFTTMLRSTFFFWTPKFLSDIGMGNTNAILKSALFPFLGALGTVLLGWYTDRYAKHGDRARAMWILLVLHVGCLLGIAALAPSGLRHANLIVGLTGLSGFFLLGPYSMSSGCVTLDIAGTRGAGTASGLIDGVGYLGGALAGWGAGKLSDTAGWSQVFLLLAGVAVGAVASAWLMSRHYRALHFRAAADG